MSRGEPTIATPRRSGGLVQAAKVPGPSAGGRFTTLPSSPEVSEYDVGATEALAYDAVPRRTALRRGTSDPDPDRYNAAVAFCENRVRVA